VKQFRIRADGARIAADHLRVLALRRLRHAQEFRIALIAALALFFAQIGAMAHAYSHAPESGTSSSQQTNLGIHDFCKDCLNFAPLLSAAGAPDALPFAVAEPCRSAPQAQITRLVDLKFRLAFRSRAPPASP
jgi:hypothetical protein